MKKVQLSFAYNLVLVLMCLALIILILKPQHTKIVYVEKPNKVNVKRNLLDETVNSIKELEGFSSKSYVCPGGKRTIGYGHQLRKGERAENIDTVFAETLLRYDLKQAFNYTDSTLKYNQRLALAHFIYGIGSTVYNKSSIKEDIANNRFIGFNLIKYCHYKHKGKMKVSNNLKKARMFELQLFYYDI